MIFEELLLIMTVVFLRFLVVKNYVDISYLLLFCPSCTTISSLLSVIEVRQQQDVWDVRSRSLLMTAF